MTVEFATCEKNTAFEYIKKVLPSKEIKEEMISKLLLLVEKDILRVQDPLMYGNTIGVVQGRNFKQENMSEVNEAIDQLKINKII